MDPDRHPGVSGLIIAAPASGSGKTTVSLGLLKAFTDRGVFVGSAKVGPDYIDPALHRAVTGRDAPNLDSWAMTADQVRSLAERAGQGMDLVICEGVMGLFDGAAGPGQSGYGATADLAAATGWPVVLVVPVRGQSQSAAALVQGFARFRTDVTVAGVILNQVGSSRHEQLIRQALTPIGIPVLGALGRNDRVALPERHLGLVQPGDDPDFADRVAALGRWIDQGVDLEAVRAIARPLAGSIMPPGGGRGSLPPLGRRIAVASDAAFTFIYPHILDGWRAAGSVVETFSPLADEPPPAEADAVYLPGGYPELHAAKLARAICFREGLRRFAATRPVYGECGGYIVLGQSLEDAEGRQWPMTGLLGLRSSFAERRLHLGYRRAILAADSPLGAEGDGLIGHEFHYVSTVDQGGDTALCRCFGADGTDLGPAGGHKGNVMGSFFHAMARMPLAAGVRTK